MRVVQVDERSSRWEDAHPVFRVYLHGAIDAASDRATDPDEEEAPGVTAGRWTDTYDVSDADVLQVVDWAQRQAGGTLRWAVALVGHHDDEGAGAELGLTWLVGMDGTNEPRDAEQRAVLDRMDRRVHDKVVVPAADRVPQGVDDACP